jgi:mono/diheme cytochrome c family protein
MEVLHDVRARRRPVKRRLTCLLLLFAPACVGGARDSVTADTAVLQGASADSLRYAIERDTTQIDSAAMKSNADSVGDLPRLSAVLAADSAAGDSLYHRKGRCLTCHGTDARGLPNLGSNLRDAEWLHSDGSPAGIAGSIAGGVSRPKQSQIRMPAFASQLTSGEIDRLAAYVYAISHYNATTTSDAMPAEKDSAPVRPDSTER